MTKEAHPDGKVLIIGGGIANFTNVAATFKVSNMDRPLSHVPRPSHVSNAPTPQGIARAISEYHHTLLEHNIKIFVRRGGPNYQEGLRKMRDLGTLCNPVPPLSRSTSSPC